MLTLCPKCGWNKVHLHFTMYGGYYKCEHCGSLFEKKSMEYFEEIESAVEQTGEMIINPNWNDD